MKMEDYFRSISKELDSLKNRVRNIIEDEHWQTDGEWKESVLRNTLQRFAPLTVTVGRGFIVDGERTSSQIDVLIYDNTYPVIYRDGNLAFISPEACLGIIEVKTAIKASELEGVLYKLANNAELARRGRRKYQVFVGLFVYENRKNIMDIVYHLNSVADNNWRRIIDHLSIGNSRFVKFWKSSPTDINYKYNNWHDYELPEMAQGYFINNFLIEMGPKNNSRRDSLWFPESGKETRCLEQRRFCGDFPREYFSIARNIRLSR